MNKLNKIRKWAQLKKFEVKEKQATGGTLASLEVVVSETLSFRVEERDSTSYMSIRGRRGNPAGYYMAWVERDVARYTYLHYQSLDIVIDSMEYKLEQDERRRQIREAADMVKRKQFKVVFSYLGTSERKLIITPADSLEELNGRIEAAKESGYIEIETKRSKAEWISLSGLKNVYVKEWA